MIRRFQHSALRGFTLIELLVVIAIIMILMALLVPVLMNVRKTARQAAAKAQVSAITVSLDKYKEELGLYPPDTVPTTVGGVVLWYHLVRKMAVGETHYGPYLEPKEGKLKPAGAFKELQSPLGGVYEYKLLQDSDGEFRRYLVVDPGDDKILGGSITTTSGPTCGWNGSTAEADDNIYSSSILK